MVNLDGKLRYQKMQENSGSKNGWTSGKRQMKKKAKNKWIEQYTYARPKVFRKRIKRENWATAK